jgi:hypothetical protein
MLTTSWAFGLDGVLLGDGLGKGAGGHEGEDEEQLHFSEGWMCSETESCWWWRWCSEVNVLEGWRLVA